ncbi:uncharacterized protein isoform X2 [Rhodnius prolixus]|uniref:uncharacterized protein isoform X2 n=1 Tax=Rhodnius prolixus TaxID=13249 RepID=UPI003D18C1D2
MRTACCSLVLIATYYFPFCNANRHRISKRFVYPSGSVIQFAMGLALPAAVIGRNIATNSGILVNYALPTNVTELKVPFSSTTRIAQEKILNEIIFMLKNNNFDEECLYKSLCLLGENKHYSASLWYQLFQTLIIEILNYYGRFTGRNQQRIDFHKNNCKYNTKECSLLKYFF